MNNNLIKILSDHLQADVNNAVRVRSNELRLKKSGGSAHKFAFTLSDINGIFENVDNLLIELPKKGFTSNVQFTLIKLYTNEQGKTSYRKFEEITEDLIETTMNNTSTPTPVQSQQQVITQTNPYQNFGMALGAPAEFINKMVEAERGKDYKKTAEELEEKLKNSLSENRILKEQNSSLEIKIATQKERAEIQRERDKMDQKSFLDSDGGAKVLETLGAIIPKAMEAFANKGAAPVQAASLASPEIEVLPVKKMAIEKIQSQNFSDEQTSVVNYILDNWEKEFIENIISLINKREENA
ncbi:hypothetical protein PL371_07730 [Tenacibaculum maritimum]|nr:hypothetical protein [Tenacibaculum maritimum]MDB0611758.1 hypothetical protein [Tenacibaculum maritimum]